MVGGPGDTQEEADAAREVIAEWHNRHAEAQGVSLVFKHWSINTYPSMTGRAQGIINSQLLDRADILVALFWNRLGQPTGAAPSGTVEEIQGARAQGKPVLLYFSRRPPPNQAMLRDERVFAEFQRVEAFRQEIEDGHLGLYAAFDTLQQFKDTLHNHLDQLVRDLKEQNFAALTSAETGLSMRAKRALREQVMVAVHAVQGIENEWNAALHAGTMEAVQATLHALFKALSTDEVAWREHLTDAADTLLQRLAKEANSTAQAQRTYGSAPAIKATGTQLFTHALHFLTGLRTELEET